MWMYVALMCCPDSSSVLFCFCFVVIVVVFLVYLLPDTRNKLDFVLPIRMAIVVTFPLNAQ